MNLILSLCFATGVQMLTVDDILMHVADSGYALERRNSDEPVRFTYRRQIDKASIEVHAFSMAGGDVEEIWKGQTAVAEPPEQRPTVAFSGAPLGDRVTYL